MGIEVKDFVSVSEALTNFGARVPTGLAILPSNLDTAKSRGALRQHVESDTVRALLRANNVAYEEVFEEEQQPAYLQQYSSEWYGPTLFISAGLLSQDPNVLSVALGLITNYLYDLFKSDKGGNASLNIVFEEADGSCKKVSYHGPHEGLDSVAAVIKNIEAGGQQ